MAGLVAHAAMSGVIAAAVGEARRGRLRHRQPGDPAARGAGLVPSVARARRPVAPWGGVRPRRWRRRSAWMPDGCLRVVRRGFAFGARFDLEVDPADPDPDRAGMAGGPGRRLDSAIGLARYAFVLAGWLLPFPRAPPPSRRRQAICVQQGVTCCSACCRRSSHRGRRRRGPGACGIVGVVRRRHHLSARTRVRSAASGAVARDPDRAIR